MAYIEVVCVRRRRRRKSPSGGAGLGDDDGHPFDEIGLGIFIGTVLRVVGDDVLGPQGNVILSICRGDR